MAIPIDSNNGTNLSIMIRNHATFSKVITVSDMVWFGYQAGRGLITSSSSWSSLTQSSWLALTTQIEKQRMIGIGFWKSAAFSSHSSLHLRPQSKSLLWASSSTETPTLETLGIGLIFQSSALDSLNSSHTFLTSKVWGPWEYLDHWDQWMHSQKCGDLLLLCLHLFPVSVTLSCSCSSSSFCSVS